MRSRGTAAVVAAARRAGIRRVVVQSSYGVGETRSLLGLVDRVFFALLIKPQIIDSEIQEGVLRGSDLDWTIVQPVHLSDDDSVDHFVSTDGTHATAQGLAPSGRATSTPTSSRARR